MHRTVHRDQQVLIGEKFHDACIRNELNNNNNNNNNVNGIYTCEKYAHINH
jgi:hypothetical protein